jgi:GntR family transcriptional regulator
MSVGDKLPTEYVLANRLQVGRSTVREALKILQSDGLVEVTQGKGSFVSAVGRMEPERPITRFESGTDMMKSLNYEARTIVVSVCSRPATGEESRELSLPPRSDVVELRRVRKHAGETLVCSISIIDASALGVSVDQIDWTGSVISLLDLAGHEIVASLAHIRAVDGSSVTAEFRDEQLPDAPWLLITERCVTTTGRCVLAAQDFHRGDMFAFHVLRRRKLGPKSLVRERLLSL